MQIIYSSDVTPAGAALRMFDASRDAAFVEAAGRAGIFDRIRRDNTDDDSPFQL